MKIKISIQNRFRDILTPPGIAGHLQGAPPVGSLDAEVHCKLVLLYCSAVHLYRLPRVFAGMKGGMIGFNTNQFRQILLGGQLL